MERNPVVIGVVLFCVLFATLYIIYLSYGASHVGSFTYTNPDGEEFRIDNRSVGNVTFYHVHSFVDNHEYIMPLRSAPGDVLSVSFDPAVIAALNRPAGLSFLYLTQDPDLPNLTRQRSFLAIIEIGKIMGTNDYGVYQIPSRSAFTAPFANSTVPVIDCSDVSDSVAVMRFQLGSSNRVYHQNDCVLVEGVDADGLMLASDRLAYHLLGVL